MCDTLIATKLATTNNIAIFGKNSDRPPKEGQHFAFAQAVIFIRFMFSRVDVEHPAGSSLKCTYIEIPQVEKTNAVLLSKPFGWVLIFIALFSKFMELNLRDTIDRDHLVEAR